MQRRHAKTASAVRHGTTGLNPQGGSTGVVCAKQRPPLRFGHGFGVRQVAVDEALTSGFNPGKDIHARFASIPAMWA